MRRIYGFFRATILGGVMVLVPVVVLAAIAVWAVGAVLKFISPVFEWLPDQSIGGVSLAMAATLACMLGACFLAGLLAETTIIRRVGTFAERFALYVPGYVLMKNVGTNLAGIDDKRAARTVLVRFSASWQIGFLMDSLPDGRQVVFIPGVPSALVGALHIVAAANVEPLPLSVPATLDALGRLGVGMRDVWPVS